MKKIIRLIFLLVIATGTNALPCTIIMVRGNGVAIAGSNEDFLTPLTMMWYTPASDKYYARICFGFRMVINSTQGGMNEKGLFVDGNSLGKQGWNPDPGKSTFMGSVLDQLLATCATVEEVKDFFRRYNCPVLDVARIPVMDKTGASMIVEWHNGDVVFLETDANYQIATNFIGSDFIGRPKPCWRYNRADSLLGKQPVLSASSVRDALSATHVEGPGSETLYSFICDLKSGDISVYNFHDFSNALKLNIHDEAVKGRSMYFMSELFPGRSPAYQNFIQEGPLKMMYRGLRSGRQQALMFYNILKTTYPDAFSIQPGPDWLNRLAQKLYQEGRKEDAVFFLERNCIDFPKNPEAHFELGKLYQESDNMDKAVKEFKKVLEIDPGHEGALKALSQIEEFL